MSNIMQEIQAERARQIESEGYTLEHDDRHPTEELMDAAMCYLHNATGVYIEKPYLLDDEDVPVNWPWEATAWKPKEPRRDLIRAGALCLAENERWIRDGFSPQALCEQTLNQIIAAIKALEPKP